MKYRTPILILILLATIISISIYNQPKACFENTCINLELAETQEEKALGLMYRDNLKPNSGMLFIYDKEDYYNIWMKNTLIPLDIIWIDKELNILQIEKGIPCEEECTSYKALHPTKYIIEVNQDFTKQHNIKVGDKVSLRNY